MDKITDGGFAFPSGIAADAMGNLNFSSEYDRRGGMSLRDYFAAKGLPIAWGIEQSAPTYDGPSYRGMAERAYFIADAMLKARSGGFAENH